MHEKHYEKNRWVILAQIIYWKSFEEEYASNFTVSSTVKVEEALNIMVVLEA